MNWQPIPTVTAPHYLDTNLNQVQKCVNWYHQKTGEGSVLMSLQGFQLVGTVANNAACRGTKYDPKTGNIYSVHGNTVYAVTGGGTSTALAGTLSTSSGDVVIAAGLSQFLIVDGTYGYIINSAGTTVTKITDSNFPSSPISCACFNGQFIVVKGLTDRWYMSAVDDGLTWTPVITGRAITNGDYLMHVEVIRDVVYFFGQYSIEPWSASTIDPYLQPITGATLPVGIVEKATVSRINDKLIFHAISANGRGTLYSLDGGQIIKIAPPYIEDKIGDWTFGTVWAYSYMNAGTEFYEIQNTTGSNDPRWLYNITNGTWSEFNSDRSLKAVVNQFPLRVPPTAFSPSNGSIYTLGTGYAPYNQNLSGNSITRALDFKMDGGMSRTFNAGLRFELEAQHDSSSSYTLSATLQKSDDAGRTFDTGITLSKAVTNGTSAQQVVLTSPPLGSFKAGRIYRLTFAGPAARLILRRAEGLVRIGRF